MKRDRDRIWVETDDGIFDAFNSIEIMHDLFDTTTATLEIGDDGTWRALERVVAPGRAFKVYVNDRLQMTGRAEVNEVPGDAERGTVVQLILRTKLADARYSSADPKTRTKDVSIKDFLVALFAPLGYVEADFQFATAADRDLITGKKTSATDPVDLEPIKPDQAKVQPGESIFDAAQRHLRRHHMMLWDAGNGRINVGRPDDTQTPITKLLSKRGANGAANNVLSYRRVVDWSEVTSELWVLGATAGRDVAASKVRGVAVDLDLAAVAASTGHFNRRVILPVDGARNQAQSDAQARRELAARSRRKNAWEFSVDGLAYWDGSALIPWAINTTTEVDVDTVGGAQARYLITRVSRRLDAESAATTSLMLVAPGVLEI